MHHHPIIVGCLLGIAVAIALICSLGLLVMRDAYQRMHYSSPIVTLSMLLITVAVFVDDPHGQARMKVVLIFLFLVTMNSILSHATARAIRIRRQGHWPADPREQIPVLENKGVAGVGEFAGVRK